MCVIYIHLQAALAKQLREAMKVLKYTPGVRPQSAAAPGKGGNNNTPSAEAKSSIPNADFKSPITPTSLFRTVSAGNVTDKSSNIDLLRRGSSSSRLPVPSKRSTSPAGSNASISASEAHNRRRLRMSLTRGVYQRSITETSTGMENMSLNFTPGTGPPPEPASDKPASKSPEKLAMEDDDLLDLFSPLHLTSIKNNRGQRKRDLVKGSGVRDYFSVFEQKEVPAVVASVLEDTTTKALAKKPRAGNAASGVGMPKAEKAFLASFSNTHKGAPGSAIQTADGLINTNITTLTTASFNSPASGAAVASYATPTLSYSWRLASRRKSTGAVSLGPAAAQAVAAVTSPANRAVSPTPNRREWSPPPRVRAGQQAPSSAGGQQHGGSSSSPGRGVSVAASTSSADLTDSLGLDEAIERLQSNLNARSGVGKARQQRGGNP